RPVLRHHHQHRQRHAQRDVRRVDPGAEISTQSVVAPANGQTGAVALNATDGVTLSSSAARIFSNATVTINADTDQNGGVYTQATGSPVQGASVSITASDLVLAGTISSSGNVTFLPSSAGETIGVGGGGDFALGDAELDGVTAGTLTIGSLANTGGIT